nr:TPM domain-containing protein [uncultured Caldimonas sp.]
MNHSAAERRGYQSSQPRVIERLLRPCMAIAAKVALLACVLFTGAATAQERPALIYRPVVDVSGSLSAEDRTALTAKLNAFEARCGSQVAVVLIDSTRPYSMEAYANALANEWKLGRPGVGDGVLLVLAMQDREMRLEVARDMEPLLPDVLAGRILRNELKPALREGRIRAGIEDTLDEVFNAIASVCLDSEALDTPLTSSHDDMSKRPLTGRALLELGGAALLCWVIAWVVTSAIGFKWVALIIAIACSAGMVLGLELGFKSTYALPPYNPHYRWLLIGAIALSLWALRWRLLERMRRNGEFTHRTGISFSFSGRSDDSGYGWRHSTGSSSSSSSDSSSSSSSSSSESGGGGSYAGGGATSRW